MDQNGTPYGGDSQSMREQLEPWRVILVTLRKFLIWEKKQYPAIIAGAVTVFFGLLWHFDPSVLTTFSLLGLTVILLDYLVPTVGGTILNKTEWTEVQQEQYEEICDVIVAYRTKTNNFVSAFCNLKTEKPTIYFVLLISTLLVLAIVGNMIDNLLLTYFVVLAFLMYPGLKRKGVLNKAMANFKEVFNRLVFGKEGQKVKKDK